MNNKRTAKYCLFAIGFIIITYIYYDYFLENKKKIFLNLNFEKNTKEPEMIIEPIQTSTRRKVGISKGQNVTAVSRILMDDKVKIQNKNSIKAYQNDSALNPIIKNEIFNKTIYEQLAERNINKFQHIGGEKKTKIFSAYYDNRGDFGNFLSYESLIECFESLRTGIPKKQ